MQSTPGWRLWGFSLASVAIACPLSVYASVKIADANAQEQLARVAAAKEQATAEQRRAACQLIGNILAAYEETPPPPSSKTGQNVVQAWREEYRIAGCPPKK